MTRSVSVVLGVDPPVAADAADTVHPTGADPPVLTPPTTSAPARPFWDFVRRTAVAAGLVAVLVASIWWRPEPFVLLVCLAVGLALWELTGGLAHVQIDLPFVPLTIGGVGMQVAAYLAGLEGLVAAFALTIGASLIWRIIEDSDADARRDLFATIFAASYVPLLGGFITLLAAADGGRWLVLLAVALPVANDTGGYLVGALVGRHRMAPVISPKKSWEGLAGSIILATAVGVVGVVMLGGQIWIGVVLSLCAAAVATLGDLTESMIKRAIGVKDMSSLLPGHGGVLDRVDSILLTAPVAYIFLVLVT